MPSEDQIAAYRAKNNIKLGDEDEAPEMPEARAEPADTTPDADAPDEALDIYKLDPDAEEEAETAAPATEETPAVTPPAEPVVEEWTPPTKEAWETERQYAERMRQTEQLFLSSAPTVVEAYFNAMTPQQQAAFLAQIQAGQPPAQAQPSAPNIPDYDEAYATPVEKAVVEQWDWIKNGPAKTEQYVQGIAQDVASRQQNYTDYRASVLEQKLNAVLQVLGVEIPDVTTQQVQALMQQGKAVPDAVKELLSGPVAQAVERAKVARAVAEKPTPRTPGAGSTAKPRLPDNASLKEIFAAKLGRALQD